MQMTGSNYYIVDNEEGNKQQMDKFNQGNHGKSKMDKLGVVHPGKGLSIESAKRQH